MACPDCGSSIGEFRVASSIETHGLDCGPFERFDEEFIVCGDCGGRFDVSDWAHFPETCGEPIGDLEGIAACGLPLTEADRGRPQSRSSRKELFFLE